MRRRASVRASWSPGLVLVAALAALAGGLAACGDGGEPARPAPAAKPDDDEVATFTQIMIGYRQASGRQASDRSKEEALALAEDLLARLRRGESMELLLRRYTDDRGPDGEPFNSGTVTLARRASPAMEVVKRTVFALRRGELHPRPVDTGLAYLLVRRDT